MSCTNSRKFGMLIEPVTVDLPCRGSSNNLVLNLLHFESPHTQHNGCGSIDHASGNDHTNRGGGKQPAPPPNTVSYLPGRPDCPGPLFAISPAARS